LRNIVSAEQNTPRSSHPAALSGESEHLHGNSDQHLDLFSAHHLESISIIPYRSVRYPLRPKTAQSGSEKTSHTPGTFSRQQDQHPRSRSCQGRHPNPKEIHRQLLILPGKEDALGFSRCPRTTERDHPLDFALGDTEECQGLAPHVLGGGERQATEICQGVEVVTVRGGQMSPVKRTPGPDPGERLLQPGQLVALDAFAERPFVGRADLLRNPRLQRRPQHGCTAPSTILSR